MLGLHMVRTSFKGTVPGDDPLVTAERLADILTPAGCPTTDFLKHSATLAGIWKEFRTYPTLLTFMHELVSINLHAPVAEITCEELSIGLELIQLMEDVFLDLRLDDFWDPPTIEVGLLCLCAGRAAHDSGRCGTKRIARLESGSNIFARPVSD